MDASATCVFRTERALIDLGSQTKTARGIVIGHDDLVRTSAPTVNQNSVGAANYVR